MTMTMQHASYIKGVIALAVAVITASAPGAEASVVTDGCGKTHLFNGITQYHGLTSSGRDRKYSIHLPSDYDESTPYPLVLGFHGSSSIGFFFEVDTKMSESRYSADKIMVYPDGVGGAWAGANYSEVSVPEDLQFVSDLLDEIRAGYCIDNSRIYATGISNGGGFVNTIACSSAPGGEFAAFAPASGSYYTDSTGGGCAPARAPLPVLEVHGGSDASVYYDGGIGEGGEEPAIPAWLGRWAERNGCGGGEEEVEDSFGGDVHHHIWTCGDGARGVLQHWKVDSMGHCWASTEINFSQIAAGQGPTHIEASRIIMDFFDQFSKP